MLVAAPRTSSGEASPRGARTSSASAGAPRTSSEKDVPPDAPSSSSLPPAALLHNLYGPTEAAVDVTWWACDPARPRVVPIGRPVANTRVHLLDRNGREVPVGVPGELYIGGVQLARGYLGRPGLTAASFVPDPFAGAPGARLYRTGDLARWLPDGAIEYLGRGDGQVKIRGCRVELGEIEAVLAAHPSVLAAAVTVRSVAASGAGSGGSSGGVPGDRRLAAYVVLRGELAAGAPQMSSAETSSEGVRTSREAAAGELRRAIAERLPEYMVPADVVVLDRLPLTASGKLDRRALPDPPRHRRKDAGPLAAAAPRTAVEELLAGAWVELLGVEAVGADDHFFALGGHSLLATRLVSRVRRLLGVEVPLGWVFERPTLAAQARNLTARMAVAGGGLSGAGPPPIPHLPPPPRADTSAPASGGELVLSFAQERLWFLERLTRGSAAYHLPGALCLCGRLDVAALARALDEVVRRHEVLRTIYPEAAGGPSVVVLPAVERQLPVLDLAALGESAGGVAEIGLWPDTLTDRQAKLFMHLGGGGRFDRNLRRRQLRGVGRAGRAQRAARRTYWLSEPSNSRPIIPALRHRCSSPRRQQSQRPQLMTGLMMTF